MPTENSVSGCHGTRIVYDVYEPQGETRAVVLVCHGLGEHAQRYRHVADRLVESGFRVVVPDHRGHGRSGGPRAGLKRWADLTDDVATVLARTRVDGVPTYVLGHSMGGTIALDFTLQHQDDVAGLVLSGAAVVRGEDVSPMLARVAGVLGKIAPGLPTQQLDSSSVSRDPAVVAAYDADPMVFRGKIPAGLAGGLLSTMATFPDRLPSLRVPVLVLHGGADRLTNPQGSHLVRERAGSVDKELKIYDGLFHEIFNEPEKDEVLGDVVAWLEQRLAA